MNRIATLCEHDKIEAHLTGWRPLPRSGIREAVVCPGGQLAPLDARIVGLEALTDAAWQFNEAVSLLRMARAAVVAIEDVQEIDEALPAMQSALEALALALKEPSEAP